MALAILGSFDAKCSMCWQKEKQIVLLEQSVKSVEKRADQLERTLTSCESRMHQMEHPSIKRMDCSKYRNPRNMETILHYLEELDALDETGAITSDMAHDMTSKVLDLNTRKRFPLPKLDPPITLGQKRKAVPEAVKSVDDAARRLARVQSRFEFQKGQHGSYTLSFDELVATVQTIRGKHASPTTGELHKWLLSCGAKSLSCAKSLGCGAKSPNPTFYSGVRLASIV